MIKHNCNSNIGSDIPQSNQSVNNDSRVDGGIDKI
jgi:hypothetical protein